MEKKTIADRLKQISEEDGLRHVDIAEKCRPLCSQFGLKMNRSDISQYISGRAEPKQNKIYIIAKALNVSEAWLMGFDVPKERPKEDPEPGALVELEAIAKGFNDKQLGRLLEYAKMLKEYKGGD